MRIPSLPRLAGAAALAVLLASACVDDDDSERSRATADPSDHTVAGPGLFDLLELDEGRATIVPTGTSDMVLAPRATVDFFDGGHRMRVDEHPGFRSALDEYRGTLEGRNVDRERWASAVLPDTDPTLHRATVVDLVAALYLPALPLWGPDGCPGEVAEVRDRHAAAPPPSPVWRSEADGAEVWDYPIEHLPRLPDCVAEIYDDELDPSSTQLRLRRSLDRSMLEVQFDPGYYQDQRLDTILAIAVTAPDPSGERPTAPATSIFDPASIFLLAINRCGELPWAYSNFMAGDSYTSPTDSGYAEPGPFTTAYVCADEVPERALTSG